MRKVESFKKIDNMKRWNGHQKKDDLKKIIK